MGCYISAIDYNGNSCKFLGNFDEDVQLTVRDIETHEILNHYDKPYGFTSAGLFATDPLYWRLYATIDYSHTVHADSDNLGKTFIQGYIDDYRTLFKVAYSWDILGKDCRTLGGVLVNTDWYYIEGDYIYVRQLTEKTCRCAENLVYRINDKKQFDRILTKLRTLKR